MIVRQKQRVPASVLYGAGGGVALIVAALISTRAYFTPVEVPACSARYQTGVRFNLARQNGDALSVADLQSRLGGRDWGMTDNSRVVRGDEAHPVALEIRLDKKPEAGTSNDDEGPRGGIGFTWAPRSLPKASAACLGYSVYVPPNFDFASGGIMPGFASDAPGDRDDKGRPLHSFSLPVRWDNEGALAVVPVGWPRAVPLYADTHGRTVLQKGRWVRIEQEIVLNNPGENNGLLRLWIDGAIRLEVRDMLYRIIDNQALSAVQADVHLANGKELPANNPAARTLKISPLEVRIQ